MSDRPVKIILVDDDSIWRLGLGTALAASGDFSILAEAEQLPQMLEIKFTLAPDLLLWGLQTEKIRQLGQSRSPLPRELQTLQEKFPNLLILLLAPPLTLEELDYLRSLGINGYCRKTAIDPILTAIDHITQGQSFWSEPLLGTAGLAPSKNTAFLYDQAAAGVSSINQELAKIKEYLRQSEISNISWLFWKGRQRELQAARWLISQLLPTDLFVAPLPQELIITEEISNSYLSNTNLSNANSELVLRTTKSEDSAPSTLGAKICRQVQLSLDFNLSNLSSSVLEIDILSPRKKRELFSLILQQFVKLYQELSIAQVELEYISNNKPKLLEDLWIATITIFFGKYSSLKVGTQEQEIVTTLLLDIAIIQAEILGKIPFVEELLSQILFETNLTIDDTSYLGNSGEAIARAELILENLIIQVANAVIQPLLNRFSEVETIKLAFYDQRLISVRDITKFRNDLSWKYRLDSYFYEPKLIFESSYQLYIFTESGIRTSIVYAPRTEELKSLTGWRYSVTLWLELKDAIAPRLKTLTSFLGQGLVYVLTQIIGRGIGLVGKGILQGIGNSFQEARAGRNRK